MKFVIITPQPRNSPGRARIEGRIEVGELINIEYEAGIMHASCSGYQDA